MVMAMPEKNLHLQGKIVLIDKLSVYRNSLVDIRKFMLFCDYYFFFLWLLFVEIALSGIFLTEFK